jgi:flavorubredoxin
MVKTIKPDIYWVGALDFNRRLFDALVPTPDGTTYNAYVVQGSQKCALIDTVDPTHQDDLFQNLADLSIQRLDYVVINHAEQDHSGALPDVLERFPDAKVVTNAKCRDQLQQLLPTVPTDKIQLVQDREVLELGGKSLEFIFAPWVHWPETQFTYAREDRVLFTCDFLGSHLATSDLFSDGLEEIYEPTKRYYAEIMMPFRNFIKGHLEKIRTLHLDVVGPSHGPIHRRPAAIIDAYRRWSADEVKNEVVVPYVSMHGSTEKMVDQLTRALIRRNIVVHPFDLSVVDTGRLAMALVEAATMVLATPTVLMGPHPLVVYAAFLSNTLKPKTRFTSLIGSFGWGGKVAEQVADLLFQLQAEMIPPVLVKGAPKAKDYQAIENLAQAILEKHVSIGIA